MTTALRHPMALVATTLLYMGPLLAGLAGFGWQMIVEFTLILTLWLVVMRPVGAGGWRNPSVIGAFLVRVALQAAVVSFCLAIGRGIGGTMGALPLLPVWVPPLMSLMAVPLARIFLNPAPVDAKPAGAEIPTGDGTMPPGTDVANPGDGVDAMPWVKRLAQLPEAAREQDLMVLIAAALQEIPPLVLLDAMSKAIETQGQTQSQSLRRAFVMAVTDTDIAGKLLGQGLLSRAFDLAGEDAARLRLFADRCARLLRARHMALMDTPQIARMADAANRHPGAAREIRALIDQMGHLGDA